MEKMKVICATCQKIRVTQDLWAFQTLTVQEQAAASHGYCPHCLEQTITELESAQELRRQYATK